MYACTHPLHQPSPFVIPQHPVVLFIADWRDLLFVLIALFPRDFLIWRHVIFLSPLSSTCRQQSEEGGRKRGREVGREKMGRVCGDNCYPKTWCWLSQGPSPQSGSGAFCTMTFLNHFKSNTVVYMYSTSTWQHNRQNFNNTYVPSVLCLSPSLQMWSPLVSNLSTTEQTTRSHKVQW